MTESMHRDHDLDLITALAESRLDDPARAQELIASCEECAELYRAHLTVREAVEAEESPQMTEMERARLHNALWAEVGESSSAPVRPASPWWYRLLPAAAVLVVAVGVGTVLNSGGDAGTEEAVESLSADSDDAGADSATEMAPQADSPSEEGQDETAETFMAPDTTAAMQGDDRTNLTEAATSDFSRAELPAAVEEFRDRATSGDRTVADDAFECDPPPEVEQLLALESATLDGDEVWFAAFGEADTVGPVVVYRRSDCEVILTDE